MATAISFHINRYSWSIIAKCLLATSRPSEFCCISRVFSPSWSHKNICLFFYLINAIDVLVRCSWSTHSNTSLLIPFLNFGTRIFGLFRTSFGYCFICCPFIIWFRWYVNELAMLTWHVRPIMICPIRSRAVRFPVLYCFHLARSWLTVECTPNCTSFWFFDGSISSPKTLVLLRTPKHVGCWHLCLGSCIGSFNIWWV